MCYLNKLFETGVKFHALHLAIKECLKTGNSNSESARLTSEFHKQMNSRLTMASDDEAWCGGAKELDCE